jgi:hypothetical protein
MLMIPMHRVATSTIVSLRSITSSDSQYALSYPTFGIGAAEMPLLFFYI